MVQKLNPTIYPDKVIVADEESSLRIAKDFTEQLDESIQLIINQAEDAPASQQGYEAKIELPKPVEQPSEIEKFATKPMLQTEQSLEGVQTQKLKESLEIATEAEEAIVTSREDSVSEEITPASISADEKTELDLVMSETVEPTTFDSFEHLVETLIEASSSQESALKEGIENEIQESRIMQEIVDKIQSIDAEERAYVTEAFSKFITLVDHIGKQREAGADALNSEEELLEQCIQLLDYLGIEYSGEDFNEFIVSLISMNEILKVKTSDNNVDNLINMSLFDHGTHEAKNWAKLTDYSQGSHGQIHQIMGMIVLLFVSSQRA